MYSRLDTFGDLPAPPARFQKLVQLDVVPRPTGLFPMLRAPDTRQWTGGVPADAVKAPLIQLEGGRITTTASSIFTTRNIAIAAGLAALALVARKRSRRRRR